MKLKFKVGDLAMTDFSRGPSELVLVTKADQRLNHFQYTVRYHDGSVGRADEWQLRKVEQ